MNAEPVFSPRLLIAWIVGAVVIFAVSLYFMGSREPGGPDSTGPNTFSRSAIGHAGIADVLQRLGIPVIKSRHDSLEKLAPGSVLVIAEPRPSRESEEAIRPLLKTDTVLLVLPKWTGEPSEQKPGWLRKAGMRFPTEAQWTLDLVAPRARVVYETGDVKWTTNVLGLNPSLVAPIQLMRGGDLSPIVASEQGALVGEIRDRNRRIWVLSDPDVIANHGLARDGNAALPSSSASSFTERCIRTNTRNRAAEADPRPGISASSRTPCRQELSM